MMDFSSVIKLSISLLLLQVSIISGSAQGIRGRVTSEEGEPLAYATVFARNLNDGIPTNQEGWFEWKLPVGNYDIIVQYLGYQSKLQTIEVKEGWVNKDFILETRTFGLQEVEVKGGQEDPALTVIRKAISKAKFHRLQVQEYKMMVYIKGTGELTNAPFFLKKKLKEEGVGLNEAYTSESVSKIHFKQPNEITETVISIRSTGENNQTSPAPYIGASFYDDQINGVISPLSRSAFVYYRFRLEGNFFDNGVLVNKIRVIPRSKGEKVFDGYIYIIEDLWAIHGLDLKTSLMGFDIRVTQQYAPVEEKIWMPLTHTYTFGGKFFGFAGEYQYLASTRDYTITLNPDLMVETEILDEKVENVPDQVKKLDKTTSPIEQLDQADQMSRKDFRKMVNAYEKEALKEMEQAEVILERNYKVDSLATKRDLTYWDSIRPVPLTEKEIKGYIRDDSLAVVEVAKESDEDSVAQKAKRKFQPLDFLTGGEYNFGKGRSAGFHTNWTKMSFNTVEGFKIGFSGFYRAEKSTKMADSVTNYLRSWNFRPEFRYGFASKKVYGAMHIRRSVTKGRPGHTWGIEAGRFIYQYNEENPINEQVNALYSLLFRQNYMKLYEKHFARFYFAHRITDAFTYRTNIRFEERLKLENHSDYSFYNKPERTYSANLQANLEAENQAFNNNKALLVNGSLEWRPGLKYSVRNGRKFPLMETAPLINLDYNMGIPSSFGGSGAANFDHLELGITHSVNFGVSGKLDFNIRAGTFFDSPQVYFMDYKHFGGNRTIFSNIGAASNYRFLDYYQYSTEGSYLSSIMHYQFRKFLFTQLPVLRFSGVRENLFLNYLKTKNSPHYLELGYSLDNLYRIFRVEFGAGFENGQYKRGGMRFGIATFIQVSMDE